MAGYYDELLKICGWELEEIELERSRMERALPKLGVGPDDMESAEAFVRQQHDVSLKGVRMLLRAWLMEAIDMVLAKEEGKKLIYYSFPAIGDPCFLIAASGENLYVGGPDMVLCSVMVHIFDKLDPLFEAGEENGMPPGHGLCSLWQIKVGMLTKGIMPPPDMGIAGGYFCDLGCKGDEYLEWKYRTPFLYLDGSMDSEWGEFPEYKPERAAYLGAELDPIFDKAKEIVGVEVKFEPEVLAKATFFREFFLRLAQLNELIIDADPVPVSTADTFLPMMLGGACTGRGITEGYKAMGVLIEETRERIDKGIGVVEKGAPRALIMIGSIADARFVRMIEDAGLAVPTTLFNLFPVDYEQRSSCITFGQIVADNYLQMGLYNSSFGMAKRSEWGVEKVKADGCIINYPFNCRPGALLSHSLKKWVEETSGIPSLCLEFDMYDPRNYSAASMRTQVETFAQMLKARKACGSS